MLRAVAFISLLLGACAMRPRYQELTSRFVAEDPSRSEIVLQVLDGSGAPVPGARIEVDGVRNRFKAVTDPNGFFRLPIDKKYSDENGLVVVVLPPGVKGYQFVTAGARPSLRTAPPLVPAADAPDGGVTTM
jgi:hypothetical protein